MPKNAKPSFSPAQISAALETRFLSNDLHKRVSLRQYFKAQLTTLWRESDSFSGKRGLGNSGWDWEIAIVLIKHGFIKGEFDYDGNLENYPADAEAFIEACIAAM
jgi:hypothetical protein